MAEAHGVDISRYDEEFLRKATLKRLAVCGIESAAAYAGHLAANRGEAEAFFRSLRNTHSDFFRNPLTFAVLEQLILPALVEEKKNSGAGEIRVWSADCAAGQEPWSLAILLEEATGGRDPSYRIFATDLDDLAQARAGGYSTEAVGNIRARHLNKYFSRQGDLFSIVPRLRAMVDFSAGDLREGSSASPVPSIYGGFDLILCCNLLFYYRPDMQQLILDKVCRALVPGGYFVTGEAERAIVSDQKSLRVVARPAPVFQKSPFPNR